jgi:lysophospholipase L1-like esterase
VDDQEWRVVSPAEDLEVSRQMLPESEHTLRLVVKGFREWERRWDPPLETNIVFRGISLPQDGKLLDPPARPARLIEYVGDSITEGVLVLYDSAQGPAVRDRWPQYSDGRRTWAYQSALSLGAEPRIVGFGRLGLTIQANGGVPPGMYSYPLIYGGVVIDTNRQPDAIVVNMGTNDGRASGEVFAPLYKAYIDTIRKQYPQSTIFCLRPFAGTHGEVIRRVVGATREGGDEKVIFVDTTGWIDRDAHTTDKVHLNLEGNRIAAEKLVSILKKEMNLP